MTAFKKVSKSKYFALSSSILLLLIMLSSCSGNVKKSFDEAGRLTSILRYNDEDQLDGKSEWFFTSGDRKMEAHYRAGKLYGPQIRYFDNGHKQNVIYYKNDLMDSISTTYSPNGDLMLLETYKEDTLHGKYQRWYENNKLAIDGTYEKGMMQGSWLFYDDSGYIIGKASFNKGTGIQIVQHPNGKLQREIHFQNNVKHGDETFFDIDGKLLKIRTYDQGNLVNEVDVSENTLPNQTP